jgi:hypothetical protein
MNACIMALMKYPRTKAHPDFQKKPAAVLAASPNEDQNSIENKMSILNLFFYQQANVYTLFLTHFMAIRNKADHVFPAKTVRISFALKETDLKTPREKSLNDKFP